MLIGSGTGAGQVVGRVIDKQLMDELGDRICVVIDGADGGCAAGADGNFGVPELADWRHMVEEALVRVARGASDLEVITGSVLPAVRIRRPGGNSVIAIHHPFWSIEGMISPLIEQMHAFHPGPVRLIDSFELARRPFHAISRLSF